MRSINAALDVCDGSIRRVVNLDALAAEWRDELSYAVLVKSAGNREAVDRLIEAGLGNVCAIESESLELGDVVKLEPRQGKISVLFRESDTHHTMFLTNRCNSLCLMCSQPPTPQDDSWLIAQALATIRHMRSPPRRIGLTGGEPLLLGPSLRHILDAVAKMLPSTQIDLLTNGRLLGERDIARTILAELSAPVSWLVPLYGHADFLHDFIVQSSGAFEQTIAGLLNLREHDQQIQLRIVLIKPVLEYLPSLCEFIGRNLPFVREVALMACEPIGYALANRDATEVDLADWSATLLDGTRALQRHRVPYVFMNTPLCSLPNALRPSASKSISDWKNVYAPECARCAAKPRCAGLFAWHERGWKPTRLKPMEEIAS